MNDRMIEKGFAKNNCSTAQILSFLSFIIVTGHEFGDDRQFHRCQAERFFCKHLIDAFDFEDDTAWLDFGDIMIDATLAFTHSDVSRFFRDRFIWENSNPNLAFPFHATRHRNTRCLDLAARQSAVFLRFEAERSERDRASFDRDAIVAAFMALPIDLSFRL